MAKTFCGTEDEADVDMCKSRRTKIMNLGANLETVKASERNAEENDFLGNVERNRFGIEHFIKKRNSHICPEVGKDNHYD